MWRVIPCYDIMMTNTWAQLNGRKHSSKTNQGNGGKLWQKWDICSAFISAAIYGWCVAKFIQPSLVITSSVFSEYSHWTHGDVKAWKHFSYYWPFVREIHWIIPSQMVIDANILWVFFVSLNRQSSYWWFWMPCCSFDITVMIYGWYNANFIQWNIVIRSVSPKMPIYNGHPMINPWGWGMGYLVEFTVLSIVSILLLLCCVVHSV